MRSVPGGAASAITTTVASATAAATTAVASATTAWCTATAVVIASWGRVGWFWVWRSAVWRRWVWWCVVRVNIVACVIVHVFVIVVRCNIMPTSVAGVSAHIVVAWSNVASSLGSWYLQVIWSRFNRWLGDLWCFAYWSWDISNNLSLWLWFLNWFDWLDWWADLFDWLSLDNYNLLSIIMLLLDWFNNLWISSNATSHLF